MRAARWSLAGLLAAVALGGCATYPETYYYDDDRGYAGGEYTYGERWDDEVDVGYRGDAYLDRWSPAWSRYYTTILYPPYGRSYDPWYTPGWYYGTTWVPGAGWHGGWSGYRDPWWYAGSGGWWGYSGWYSPYRHGWYDPWYGSSYGWGHGYGGGYSWRDQQRAWRDHERRYGRRGYEPSRRWGRDATASDEVARIARERDDRGGRYGDDRPGRAGDDGYRGGAPSAYDRREPRTPYGTPSRFGNPRAAEPPAPPQGRTEGDAGWRTDGYRNSGRVTAMPDGGRSGGGVDDGNLGERYRGIEADPRRGSRSRWSTEPADRTATPGADWNRPREDTPARWSRPAAESYPRDRVYRTEPRNEAPTRYEAPARFERPRYESSSRDEAPARYEAPTRFESPSRNERSRFDMPTRSESPRYEAPSRNDSPRYEAPSRSESPRFEMPSRNDSPRFESPSRGDDGSASRRGPERSDSEQQDR